MNAGQVIRIQASLNPGKNYDVVVCTSNYSGHPGFITGKINPENVIPNELFYDPLRSHELAEAMVRRYGPGLGFPPRPTDNINGPAVPTADFANGGWLEGENWEAPTAQVAQGLGLDILPGSKLAPADEMDLRAAYNFTEQIKIWNKTGMPNTTLPGSTSGVLVAGDILPSPVGRAMLDLVSSGLASTANAAKISDSLEDDVQKRLSEATSNLSTANLKILALKVAGQRAAKIAEDAIVVMGPAGGGLPIKRARAALNAIIAALAEGGG